uniref:Uncharacterized protein n=1 Tax=uncultured prokaryote TaxID=198431 RepID=A0A0H5Q7V8_9ZZZZ|nr:hypothetical protein [uncultured prokaryote]
MTIPVGYAQVLHSFTGNCAPSGAAITFGVDLGTVLDPAVVAQDMHEAFADNFMPRLTNQITLAETLVKFGPDETGPSAVYADGVNGSSSDAALLPNSSILIRKVTFLGGRQGRGRVFVPGMSEEDVTASGYIESLSLAAHQTAADAWLAAVNDASVTMVLLHSDSLVPTEVTSLSVAQIIATQRRRLRR